jgi:hypothetical protein
MLHQLLLMQINSQETHLHYARHFSGRCVKQVGGSSRNSAFKQDEMMRSTRQLSMAGCALSLFAGDKQHAQPCDNQTKKRREI